ncbi:DUF1692-domain-containing protein [Mytilinidion resinicola]|uniref:Endoplasmic reticulum-Golgi intermediate compartment protein n=1 Tax=Mytilinidion resinicola TaxID=574789 RepID=A0A6A6Z8C0_9PEZI|nr:DUF1692-domain-containing protein [Mytilinidion resinicola]KAF2817371.1 DUF1692-domain-containing protein [Mytilinidion resinicola]
MNGFTEHGLSEDAFGASKGGISSFDAFPKTKPTYLARTRNGGAWTLVLLVTCAYLLVTETVRWFTGTTSHTFSVEKGVSHDLQINIDFVVAMKCPDLHVNVQDAAGDRILAGDMLHKDPTSWRQAGKSKGIHTLGSGPDDGHGWEDMEDVHDFLGAAKRKRKFKKTPKLRGPGDACRIYGSLDGNKVQGDFHITARGHGYAEFGEHLDHSTFNFSHYINELSFGPFYPSLENPLDATVATTPNHFYKFQYYLSIVPTIYTTDTRSLNKIAAKASPSASDALAYAGHTIWTNQYAATSQSHLVGENQVPGIFVKFDIEPITLTIAEEWGGFLALLVRLVNVISGVIVAGSWCYQLFDWSVETWGRRGRRREPLGVLTGRQSGEFDEKRAYD